MQGRAGQGSTGVKMGGDVARCPEAKMPAGCRGYSVGQKARKVKGDVGVVRPPIAGEGRTGVKKGASCREEEEKLP